MVRFRVHPSVPTDVPVFPSSNRRHDLSRRGLHADDGFRCLVLEPAGRSLWKTTDLTAIAFRMPDRDLRSSGVEVVHEHHGRSCLPRFRCLCPAVSWRGLHEGDVSAKKPWYRAGSLDLEHHLRPLRRSFRLRASSFSVSRIRRSVLIYPITLIPDSLPITPLGRGSSGWKLSCWHPSCYSR